MERPRKLGERVGHSDLPSIIKHVNTRRKVSVCTQRSQYCPHIPIRRVEQRPDMLSSLGRRADTSRQHRSIPYIEMYVSTPARNYQQTRSPDCQTYLLGTQGCAQTHRRPESHASTQNACARMHITAKDSRRPVVMPEAIRSPQSDLRMSYSPGEGARCCTHGPETFGNRRETPGICKYVQNVENGSKMAAETARNARRCTVDEITKLTYWHQRIAYICGRQLQNPCCHIYQAENKARLTAVGCCDCASAMFQLASPNYGVVASDGIQNWLACRKRAERSRALELVRKRLPTHSKSSQRGRKSQKCETHLLELSW